MGLVFKLSCDEPADTSLHDTVTLLSFGFRKVTDRGSRMVSVVQPPARSLVVLKPWLKS